MRFVSTIFLCLLGSTAIAAECDRWTASMEETEVGPLMTASTCVPASASKGGAVDWLLQQSGYAGRTPVFIGDDITDENGFEAVNAANGLSIRIGDGQTCARHRLASPTALRHVLLSAAEGGDLTLETFLQG